MTVRGSGLRELKKRMTRESIAEAALRLALDKGLDQVTIDEIAEEALISPRTVSNYFSSKEEAVVAAGAEDPLAIVEQLAQRPPSEPPLESLRDLLIDFARSLTEEQLRRSVQKIELGQQHPSLRPYQTAQYDHLEEALRVAVAERTGTDVDRDVYPWLVAAAAVSAFKSAMRLWAASPTGAEQLPEFIRTAFNEISEGLPAPEPLPPPTTSQ